MAKLRTLFLIVGIIFAVLAGITFLVHIAPQPYTVINWNCGTQGYHKILFPAELAHRWVDPTIGYIRAQFVGDIVIISKAVSDVEGLVVVNYLIKAISDCPEGILAICVFNDNSIRYWKWIDLKPVSCSADEYYQIVRDAAKRFLDNQNELVFEKEV